jgi:hypothetical protein
MALSLMKPKLRVSAFVVLAVVLVAGCGAPGPARMASHSTSTAAASAAPISPTSSAASEPRLASPPAQIGPPVLVDKTFQMLVTFNCRLPARLIGSDDGSVPGFLDLATGHFVSDPGAELTKIPNSWDDWRTVATPVLRGFTGITYSRGVRRWIPADRLQVSPDGIQYAYPEVPTPNVNLRLHVVDLAAGTDQVVSTGTNWAILDYRTGGIYVTQTRYYSGESNSGLWLMSPLDGSVQQLLPASATTLFLGGAAAWGSDKAILPTVLYRYDLATGARSVWFTRSGRNVQFIGADDAGHPLADVFSTTDTKRELWLLTGPSKGTVIYSGNGGPEEQNPVIDSHGVWIAGGAGLWLLQPGGQLAKVSTAPAQALGGCH